MRRIIRYLFPRLRAADKLPRLPRRISGEYSVYGKPPTSLADEINLLKALSLARTDADAHRLLVHHNGKPLADIIRIEERQRRRSNRFRRAWNRLKARW